MATGQYKNGFQINLVYQAAGLLSNAIPVGTVYDEGSAVHVVETTALTSALLAGELADPADGRYLGHFTPDAEGMWTVVIKDKNGAGEVVKHYDVAGHDLDGVGDAVAALDDTTLPSQILLAESGIKSDATLQTSDIKSAITKVTASQVVIAESGIKSDLVLVESGLKSAALLQTSDIKSAITKVVASQVLLVISAVSDVESAVDLIGSTAQIS